MRLILSRYPSLNTVSPLNKYQSFINNNAVGIEVDGFILYLNKDAPLPDIPGERTFGEGPGGFLTEKNESVNFIRPTVDICRNGKFEHVAVEIKIIRRNFDCIR